MRAIGAVGAALLVVGATLPAEATSAVTTRPDPEGVATRVTVRQFILDVAGVDDTAQSFEADLHATFQWRDERLRLPPDTEDASH